MSCYLFNAIECQVLHLLQVLWFPAVTYKPHIYMYVYIFWPLSAGAVEVDPALGFRGVLFPREILVDDVSLKSSPSLFAG